MRPMSTTDTCDDPIVFNATSGMASTALNPEQRTRVNYVPDVPRCKHETLLSHGQQCTVAPLT